MSDSFRGLDCVSSGSLLKHVESFTKITGNTNKLFYGFTLLFIMSGPHQSASLIPS